METAQDHRMLLVIDDAGKLTGVVHMQDLLRAGVV